MARAANGNFPKGFDWCVASAAHQIEGYNTNSDWWAWEQLPGKIKNGERSGAATDHWNRLFTDVQILNDLNVTQYRFGVEWAKIEPSPGQWDWEAVSHYRFEIALLKSRGIEPLVTLNHFTLPLWVSEKGGWEWKGIPAAFEKYTEFVYSHIGEEVSDWITLNEPMVQVTTGYLVGVTPPGKTDISEAGKPLVNMIKAHAAAYHKLHRLARTAGKRIKVGVAHHLRSFDSYNWWNPLDAIGAATLDGIFNWSLPLVLKTGHLDIYIPFVLNINEEIPEATGTQDFFGLNYYTRDLVQFSLSSPILMDLKTRSAGDHTDLGWEIYPKGMHRALMGVKKRFPKLKILITENGLADKNDSQRADYLESHLREVLRAIDDGAKVVGYCHWSFIDNFEWVEGFEPRFGLYEVDYSTFHRTARPSAAFFADIAIQNRLRLP